MNKEYVLNIIEELFGYISKMRHVISVVRIANLNFDTPRWRGFKQRQEIGDFFWMNVRI